MTFMTMITRSFARNRTRVVITGIGAIFACVGFILLQTVRHSWTLADGKAANRVVTRHAMSLTVGMSRTVVGQISQNPGVAASTGMVWLGAGIPGKDIEFTSLAVDDKFLSVFDDVVLDDAARQKWQTLRQGVIVSEELARDLGCKVGDSLSLEAGMWPREQSDPWQVTVAGIFTSKSTEIEPKSLYVRYDYFNDSLISSWRDQVRLVYSRLKPGASSAVVSKEIDQQLADIPSFTTDQATASKSFLSSVSALFTALNAISIGMLSIAILLTVSLVSMSTRERVREFGVLRAIGFSRSQVALLIIGEPVLFAALTSAIACVLGVILTRWVVGPALIESSPDMFSAFPVSIPALVWVMVTFTFGGFVAGALPAHFALRIRTTDALRDIG